MSFKIQQKEVDQYMTSNWTHTEIARDNANFESGNLSEWIRVSIRHGNSDISGLGTNRSFRHKGIVTIQIFTLFNKGVGRALELADYAYNLFNSRQIGSSQFETPSVVNTIPVDGQWHQINVDCPYYREEFES